MKTYLTLFFIAICQLSFAQINQELSATISRQDSLFWDAFNKCDTVKMGSFFTEDVEFYHDNGGPTLGLTALVHTFSANLCSNKNFHLRRDAVQGSFKVFPLKKAGAIYGAILSGEHVFYVLEAGKPPRADGLAKFTHLWLLKDGVWKMKNVLSYDHSPVPEKAGRE